MTRNQLGSIGHLAVWHCFPNGLHGWRVHNLHRPPDTRAGVSLPQG
jgi:hypothetical protein